MTEEPEVTRRDEELFAELYPSLRRLAAAVRAPEDDADDLVQEALARALAIGPLSARENPSAYLRAAIVRLASNQRRWLGRRRRAFTRAVPPARREPPELPVRSRRPATAPGS